MGKLTTKDRKDLSKGQFAGPDRSYPIPDKAHAADAKARASEEYHKGRISKSQEESIDRKANKVLGEHGNSDNAKS
jgi:hypothetical protein